MNDVLMQFPATIRDDIAFMCDSGGVLDASRSARMCQQLNVSIDELMIKLLPLASAAAYAPVSGFKVGAVVRGGDDASLYLGANFEFSHQALCHSVHAEQAAVSNAWLQGESKIDTIAVTAAPCGHCRQFLFEAVGEGGITILLPLGDEASGDSYRQYSLNQLLPLAFGPKDLGFEGNIMQSNNGSNQLALLDGSSDQLVELALHAAESAYAPYTANYAGCAIALSDGSRVVGRYAENAAHNPSLSALASALSQVALHSLAGELAEIERLVLVETAGAISQRKISETLANAYAPGVALEYFVAQPSKH